MPEYYAQNLLGGSGVGGPFGLLENGARMSAQVTVATRGGRIVGTYADKQSIPQNNMAGIRQGELFAYYTHSNWSVGSLIELLQQDQDGKPKPKPRGTPTPQPGDQDSRSLARAYNLITKNTCINFINQVIQDWKREERNNKRSDATRFNYYSQLNFTLDGNNGAVTINYTAGGKTFTIKRYHDSLTASDMGISNDKREEVRTKFKGTEEGIALGFTNPAGQIYLGDGAFEHQYNGWIRDSEGGNLPGIIVHELFHVAGIPDSYIEQKNLNNQIRTNCGIGYPGKVIGK